VEELIRWSRHRNFYLAVGLGLLAFFGLFFVDRSLSLLSAVNVFFVVYMALTFLVSHKLSAAFLRQHAAEEDAPAPFILLVMLIAVVAASFSFFLALNGQQRVPLQLGLGIASTILGWFAVHTMWALHYAFEYYLHPVGGLDFPGDEDPNGVAFLYFSYVIGMTAQTSDTAVTSANMRKLVLVQSVFSFFFNTVIVAAAVNIIVALAH
jgi:uncharacterized membrane protein